MTILQYASDVGDGVSTAIVITHNLDSKDVVVEVYDQSTFAEVECDVERTSLTTLTLRFSVAPTAAQYRVAVIG